MKKLFLALFLAVLTISFVGCGGEVAQISIVGAETDIPEGLLLYPPKIRIENVSPGAVIEAPSLFLQNGYDYDLTVDINLERPDRETQDYDTKLTYQPAPEGFEVWLSNINWTGLVIPAKSKASIPITIILPKEMQSPDRWEFDVKVSESSGGFIQTAYLQRWLITMER